MAEEAFAVHKITDNRRKMLELRMALTQEVRALTAYLTAGYTDADYDKLATYLRKYGTRTDVQKLRAMVAKRPIGDKTPSEHLQALRIEFGTKPDTLPLLKRIFEDSLAPHIAALISSENITDIDSYADRANELYILYEPTANTTIAKIATSEVTFANEELLLTLKNLSTQVSSLTADLNILKEQKTQHQEISQVSQEPQASYRQPQRYQPQQYQPQEYRYQPQVNYMRQPAPPQFRPPPKLSPQTGAGQIWRSQPNSNGQFTRPPRNQPNNWRSEPQQPYNYNKTNDFSAPINRQGLCPYHERFGSQAKNCKPGCIYYATNASVAAFDYPEN